MYAYSALGTCLHGSSVYTDTVIHKGTRPEPFVDKKKSVFDWKGGEKPGIDNDFEGGEKMHYCSIVIRGKDVYTYTV